MCWGGRSADTSDEGVLPGLDRPGRRRDLPLLASAADLVPVSLAAAGATTIGAIPLHLRLHLRPGARKRFLGWLSRERPGLV